MSGGRSADRCAVVSGGARGIGRAITERILDAGGRVVFGDVDVERGEEVAARWSDRSAFLPWDIRNEHQTSEAFALAESRFGRVDQVYANAGLVGVMGPIADTDVADWADTVDVLLNGTFLTIKHAVRSMGPFGSGSIVCTASVASMRGGLGPHAYTAAKFAVRGLVESVAVEISPMGLRINAVAPGGVASSLSASLFGGDRDDVHLARDRLARQSSSGVATTAEDVADAALFLAGRTASRINGTVLVVDGGDAVLASRGRGFHARPTETAGESS